MKETSQGANSANDGEKGKIGQNVNHKEHSGDNKNNLKGHQQITRHPLFLGVKDERELKDEKPEPATLHVQ
jgi:hypothetical protein